VNVSTEAKPQTAAETKDKPKPRRRRPRTTAPAGHRGSDGARRAAAAVLEVLAGARTPTEAAEALGVSANRYYQLEARALRGLVEACEPRPRGPGVAPEKELAKLHRETDRLRVEAARYQALARASQKTVGLQPPKPSRPQKGGGKKRGRKPSVRALKVARALATEAPPAGVPAVEVTAEGI
jgi:hypothetical protein